jgi:membrane protein DedA with SNARE-associated domain
MSSAITISGHGAVAAYSILFALLALAWAGLPTAGQAALVGAGVLAGNGQLDIVTVVIVGTAGSFVGGIAGYVLGLKGGRAAWSAPGPLYHRRLAALRTGDKLFARYGALAAFFVPMWLLGIVGMPWRKFLLWNTLAALAWTTVGALGGYFVGPAVTPLLGKASTALAVAGAVAIAGAILYRSWRRRAERSSTTNGPDAPPR